MALAGKVSYNKQINTVDLTTVEPNQDDKCYLIDKRLLDTLLSKVTKGDLQDIKDDLTIRISTSKDKEELFARMDDYIYLDKIVNLASTINEIHISKSVGKIALDEISTKPDYHHSKSSLA